MTGAHGSHPQSGGNAQRLGERFAQLYYGLLAVKPSALSQFYTEDSQMSRIWCGAPHAPDQLPETGVDAFRGMAQITTAIMASVGGQDPPTGEPVVVTNVESVQSCALGNLSGVLAHITGLITFVAENKMRRFSQSVVLEVDPKGRQICVRSDIVHYDDPHASQRPPAPLMAFGQMIPQTNGLMNSARMPGPGQCPPTVHLPVVSQVSPAISEPRNEVEHPRESPSGDSHKATPRHQRDSRGDRAEGQDRQGGGWSGHRKGGKQDRWGDRNRGKGEQHSRSNADNWRAR